MHTVMTLQKSETVLSPYELRNHISNDLELPIHRISPLYGFWKGMPRVIRLRCK